MNDLDYFIKLNLNVDEKMKEGIWLKEFDYFFFVTVSSTWYIQMYALPIKGIQSVKMFLILIC